MTTPRPVKQTAGQIVTFTYYCPDCYAEKSTMIPRDTCVACGSTNIRLVAYEDNGALDALFRNALAQ